LKKGGVESRIGKRGDLKTKRKPKEKQENGNGQNRGGQIRERVDILDAWRVGTGDYKCKECLDA